ncbi:hypothetical protein ACXZ83_00730 [Streptococcus agalactiae]|uniref:hypothetical protein n=1 Tax=Streptococcus agalactiae TaxID=1311 RepID=UPI0003108176|nr:hypothetical protein [Streptococcus agalactiae]EPX04605.1 hypothetical protein SAG0163_01585 [Streptococcus agalactiae MRI Z1-215]OCL40048.1 hypothetical protein AX277_04605 [Streptococcus agalactiae]
MEEILLGLFGIGLVILAEILSYRKKQKVKMEVESYTEEELALADFLEKRQAINEAYLATESKLRNILQR